MEVPEELLYLHSKLAELVTECTWASGRKGAPKKSSLFKLPREYNNAESFALYYGGVARAVHVLKFQAAITEQTRLVQNILHASNNEPW